LNIDAYCLPDLPLPSSQLNLIETKQQIDNIDRSKGAKQQLRNLPLLTKRASINKNFVNSMDKQQILRTHLIEKSECMFFFVLIF
jgi:hypothetical protein